MSPVSQATATTFDFGPKLLDNFIAPATFIPVEVPQNIPSLEASSLQVCLAKDSSIEITSSTYSELYIAGTNPRPTPSTLCAPLIPFDNIGELAGSRAMTLE